jgi:hypothetical protein
VGTLIGESKVIYLLLRCRDIKVLHYCNL